MRISDEIAAYILHMLDETQTGETELQRNTLAEQLGCVPSQISYVLSSRFTPELGYIVESRRGGGGYVRIRRIRCATPGSALMHVVNAVGDSLSQTAARVILQNLLDGRFLTSEQARLMAVALSDNAYHAVDPARRDQLRASLLKQMLTALAG